MLIEEGLSLGDVFQPGKGVVPLHVVQLDLIHLAGEPLAAVDTDIDAEGEPGLDAGVHEAEDGVHLIVIQVQTFALAIADLQLSGVVVFVDGEGHAGIDAAEHADEAVLDMVAARDRTGDVLFGVLGRVEVTDLAALIAWLGGGKPLPGER